MTDEQYQKMMGELARSGKISGAVTDMQVPERDLMRRIIKAKKLGLIKKVDPVESYPTIEEEFAPESNKAYIESRPQVEKNYRELLMLGVPAEKLAPFMQKKSEESLLFRNLNRRNADQPMGSGTLISDQIEDPMVEENQDEKKRQIIMRLMGK